MRRAPILVLTALFLVTAACNASDAGGATPDGGTTDGGSGSGGGGGGQTDGGSGGGGGGGVGNCVNGQTRCNGDTYESCENQTWTTVTQCAAPQVCVQKLSGCADCNPLHPTACQGNDVHSCNSDGTLGGVTQSCGSQTCQNGACVSSTGGGGNNCASGTQLIYVVDDANDLLSFDPQHNNTLTKIGTLSCNASTAWPGFGGGQAFPFSMSVDRAGNAWVLYSSGQIFKVPVSNPSQCTNSGFTPGASGYQLMGMGFVATSPGAQTEHLYIAGGTAGRSNASGNLGYIDPSTLQVTTVGTFTAQTYGPELTGTGDAKLYGYFPDTSNTRVVQIDPATGAEGQSWSLPALSGSVNAWAFAHWGGRFYIFVTVGGNSQILMLDPTNNGAVTTIAQNLKYTIVGAGVSTCAPTTVPPP